MDEESQRFGGDGHWIETSEKDILKCGAEGNDSDSVYCMDFVDLLLIIIIDC